MLFFVVVSLLSISTADNCFVEPTWTKSDVVVYKDIEFGSAFNNATGKQEVLLLDAYSPPATDTRSKRPAVVLVHGGSFMGGDKTSDGEPDLAYAFVTRGFAAVSINYRLTGNYYGLDSDKPPLIAQEDARAAIRFLRKMATEWKIDPERIALAGDSAGAVTSLYRGYVHKAQEGNSGNPGFSSNISLSIPISGMLADEAFCKSVVPKPSGCQVEGPFNYTNNVDGSPGQPPLLMVHGTADLVVPYVDGLAVYNTAKAAGLQAKMITIPGAGHVPMQELLKSYFKEFMEFVADAMDLAHAQCPQK